MSIFMQTNNIYLHITTTETLVILLHGGP